MFYGHLAFTGKHYFINAVRIRILTKDTNN